MSDYRLDLASSRVGGRALAANDEFFAGKENLVAAAEPIFLPDKYIATGKWMDGWETRRRREPGHDWCIVALGMRGIIDEIVVDTAYFRGNYPEACSIEACDEPGQVGLDELIEDRVSWREIAPRSPLVGDGKNPLAIADDRPVTHLRLRIYPDGGVARLRAYGRAVPDWDRLDFEGGPVDLVAIENGGRVVDSSDDFFGSALNLIGPGQPADMRDGWETRRRRGPGHDWIVLALGAPGRIRRLEVDTSHFKGNAPGRVSLQVCDLGACHPEMDPDQQSWRPLLPEMPVAPHARQQFDEAVVDAGRATHVRLNIFPDGGVARLRLWGISERAERLARGLAGLCAQPADQAEAALRACCGSQRWAREMTAARPFGAVADLMLAADRIWQGLGADDWREAFAAHPRIGERKASEGQSASWSRGEQAGVDDADADVMTALDAGNRDYDQRFGHVFLICATGKSADEMLAALRARLDNDPATELGIAADEQRKITRIRLEKLLSQ